MGQFWTKIFRHRDVRVVFLGLDAVGKTTLLYKLKLGEVISHTVPTIGFNVETIQYRDIHFTTWDIGSRDKVRPLFRHYYKGMDAVVVIIDSTDSERLDELNYDVIKPALGADELSNSVFLFLANKCDLPNTMSTQEIADRLNLKAVKHTCSIIPPWIRGSLYRNGPGQYEVGDTKFNHLFDPMAMFQRFHVSDGKAYYQCRYLRSDTYKRNMAANRIVVTEVGTVAFPDPCKNIFQRFLSYFQPNDKPRDNTLVSFYPMKDELYASTETDTIHKVDPETLDSLGKVEISKYVAVNMATAHPHWDIDGTLHNIGYSFAKGPKVCLIKFPPKDRPEDDFPHGKVVASLPPCSKFSINYFHSFAMTENYYIFVAQPLYINLLKVLAAHFRGAPPNTSIEWWPDIKAKFRIIRKSNGEEVSPDMTYEADPFMVFHHCNAYEDNEHIVIDLCAFTNKDAYEYLNLKNLQGDQCLENWRKIDNPEARRYILPLNIDKEMPLQSNLLKLANTDASATLVNQTTINCKYEKLASIGLEFPQIHYQKYNTKKYKYLYGIGWHKDGKHFNTLAKIDVQSKTYLEWAEDNAYPSEPVFVPDPNGAGEDDGVLMSAVNDTDFESGKQAFLLILNAKTMHELARVHFNIPRFPRDFHGLFRNA